MFFQNRTQITGFCVTLPATCNLVSDGRHNFSTTFTFEILDLRCNNSHYACPLLFRFSLPQMQLLATIMASVPETIITIIFGKLKDPTTLGTIIAPARSDAATTMVPRTIFSLRFRRLSRPLRFAFLILPPRMIYSFVATLINYAYIRAFSWIYFSETVYPQ